MAYSDFTLEGAVKSFGLATAISDLFHSAPRPSAPAWLPETLGRCTCLSLFSEKARGEFLVAPILLAARELSPTPMSIYSGQPLDVDPSRGLVGTCDFILSDAEPIPMFRSPLAILFQARQCDIEEGTGPCVAQMVAARNYNEAAGSGSSTIYGCVTSGDIWQFLRLAGSVVFFEDRYYLSQLGEILGAFQLIFARHQPPAPSIP